MGIALCLLTFGAAFLLTRRSLGTGAGFVVLVGCLHGWLRCRFYNPASHFTFDAALIGHYLATFTGPVHSSSGRSHALRTWAFILATLPLGVLLFSPFIDAQPLLVQLVGLRSVLLFVPLLLVASRFRNEDVSVLSDWALLSVFVASFFALGTDPRCLAILSDQRSLKADLLLKRRGSDWRTSYSGELRLVAPLWRDDGCASAATRPQV